jgi:hypothetical protein
MWKKVINPVMFLILVSLLTNHIGWAFTGEAFAHELDHEQHMLSPDPATHLEAHQHKGTPVENNMDASTHLCLHAFGQLQPFFFTAPPVVAFTPVGAGKPVTFISGIIPDPVPDSLLRPPRSPDII